MLCINVFLFYIWHDYRYWCKILFDTIPTPAYDLDVKVTDSEIYVKSFASKFLRSLDFFNLALIYLIFGKIIDIGQKFCPAISPPYDLEGKVTDIELLC